MPFPFCFKYLAKYCRRPQLELSYVKTSVILPLTYRKRGDGVLPIYRRGRRPFENPMVSEHQLGDQLADTDPNDIDEEMHHLIRR